MDEFYFDDDREEKIKFIKKIILITIVFIIIFLILRSCTNHLTNKIREDIENEKNAKIEQQEKETEIDMNRTFASFNIDSNEKLHNLIKDISKNLKPKELQNFIDYDMYNYKHNWEAYDDLNDFFINWLPLQTYSHLLELLFDNQVNYSEAPLTEHFKEKFDSTKGILYDYGLEINNQEFYWVGYDYEKKYFVVETNRGSEIFENIDKKYIYSQDYHYFNFILDEDGYLDDIVFDHIKHITDEYGEKIPELDKYLMNDEQVVYDIIKWLCIPLKYGKKTAPVDDWYHAYDEDLEYGFTDRFREYSKNLRPNGLLGYEDYENFSIESIDMNMKTAVVKVELEDRYVYYDIVWTTDDNYRMDTVEARINHSENK